MIETTGEPETPDPKAFDRFADIARKVFAAPEAEVEKRLHNAEAQRKAKSKKTKQAG